MNRLPLLLALLGTAHATPPAQQSQPAVVRFGPLYWVAAHSAPPRLSGGQVIVPLPEACDLLGLTCTPSGNSYVIGTQTLPVQATDTPPLVPLKTLAGLAGQQVHWDARSRAATVTGGQGNRGWRALPAATTTVTGTGGPISSTSGPRVSGRPTTDLTVHDPAGIRDLTLYSKVGSALTTTGRRVRGSADVPNTSPGCQGARTCTLPVPRDALWVLAEVTRQ